MPDPIRLLNTIQKAADWFRRTPGRQGRYVEPTEIDDVVVAGDLHGQVVNFRKLLDFADLSNHPRRHFVVQELIHGTQMYPDGGEQSHRLVDLIAATKCLYPNRVHYLLGNHELAQWTSKAISKNNEDLNLLFKRGVETAYGQHADNIYEAYKELFRALPVAIKLPNRVLLCHSQPGRKRLADWTLDCLKKEVLADHDVSLGGGLHATVWGREVDAGTTELFLKKMDCDLLVSGHVPCDEGFQVPNPKQLIIDSKDDQGVGLLLPATQPVTQADLLAGLVKLCDLR